MSELDRHQPLPDPAGSLSSQADASLMDQPGRHLNFSDYDCDSEAVLAGLRVANLAYWVMHGGGHVAS